MQLTCSLVVLHVLPIKSKFVDVVVGLNLSPVHMLNPPLISTLDMKPTMQPCFYPKTRWFHGNVPKRRTKSEKKKTYTHTQSQAMKQMELPGAVPMRQTSHSKLLWLHRPALQETWIQCMFKAISSIEPIFYFYNHIQVVSGRYLLLQVSQICMWNDSWLYTHMRGLCLCTTSNHCVYVQHVYVSIR